MAEEKDLNEIIEDGIIEDNVPEEFNSGYNEDLPEMESVGLDDMFMNQLSEKKSAMMLGLDKLQEQLDNYDMLMQEANQQSDMADYYRDLEQDMVSAFQYDNITNPDFDENDRLKVLKGRENTHNEKGHYKPDKDYDPTTDPAFTGVDDDGLPLRVTEDGNIESKKVDPNEDLLSQLDNADPSDLSDKINQFDQNGLPLDQDVLPINEDTLRDAISRPSNKLRRKARSEARGISKDLTRMGLDGTQNAADKLRELTDGKIDIDPNDSQLYRVASGVTGLSDKKRKQERRKELRNKKPSESDKFFKNDGKVEKTIEDGKKQSAKKDAMPKPKIGSEGLTQGQAEAVQNVRNAAKAAEAASDVAAGAATAGLYTAAKTAAKAATNTMSKAVDITTGGMSENLSSTSKCGIMVCGCILLPVAIIVFPFLLIASFFTVLFSNLLGGDGIKQNRSIAESSFVYKEANARTGFKVSDVVSTPSEDVFEIVWDAKIYNKNKRKSYEKQQEAMKKSENYGKKIAIYADPDESFEISGVNVEENVQGYNGKNSYVGDYLKIKFTLPKDHPKVEDGTLETDFEEFVPREYETEDTYDAGDSSVKEDKPKIYVYGYIRKNHTVHMPTSDPFFEYHPEDEYKILSNALKIVLQERHSESMSYVVGEISKKLDSNEYNKFNVQLREIEDEEEILYVNGKDDNVIDPEGAEFNSGKSMASIQDMGANGQILDADVAKALAAYVTSKAEKIPDKGYFEDFDNAFYDFIKNQFTAHIGQMDYEEKTRKVKTADLVEKEVLVDAKGKGLMLPREAAEKEDNQWGLDPEKDTADYVLVNTESYSSDEEYREDEVVPKTYGYKKVDKGTGDYILVKDKKYNDQTFISKEKAKVKFIENVRDEEYTFKEYFLPTSIEPFEINKLLDKLFEKSKYYDGVKNYDDAKDLPYYQYENQYEYQNNKIEVQLDDGSSVTVKAKDIEKYRKEMNAYLLENGINSDGMYQGTFYITDKEFDALITFYNDVYAEGRDKIEADEVSEEGWLYLMRIGFIDDDGYIAGGTWEYEDPADFSEMLNNAIIEDNILSEDEIENMDNQEVGDYISDLTDEEIDINDEKTVAFKKKQIKDLEAYRKREIKVYLENRHDDSFISKIKDNTESSDSWSIMSSLENAKDRVSNKFSIWGNTVLNKLKGEENSYDKAVEDNEKKALNQAIGKDEGVHPIGGERFYYQEELVCRTFGIDEESNCGAKPKYGKIPILTKLGPVQKYKLADTPLLYDVDFIEQESKTGTSVRVAFTVESRINYIEDNMFELLEEVVGSGRNGINGVAGEDIVAIARNEIGNVGGKEYQMWFYGANSVQGIPSHVGSNQTMWCAIFISWAAEQLGLIDAGVVPKDAGVVGFINFYRSKGAWHYAGNYIPEVGDFVVYDFSLDGNVEHIEIVSEVTENGFYSIGGNTVGGSVTTAPPGIVWEHERMRSFNEPIVYGFAKPDYPEYGADLSGSIEQYIKPSYQAAPGFIETLGKSVIAGSYEFGDQRLARVLSTIKSRDNTAYNEITAKHGADVLAEFEDKFGIKDGNVKPNPSKESMELASELLNTAAGKKIQDEIIRKDIKQYLNQVEKLDSKGKLNGKSKALLVGEAVKYKNTFNMDFLSNADVVRAIKRSTELEGTLPSVRAEIDGLKPENLTTDSSPINSNLFTKSDVKKHMSALYTADATRLVTMDDKLFAEDIVGDLPPNGSYLNGPGQPAQLCKMDGRATTMKTYMDYKAITATASQQWHLQNTVTAGQRATTDPVTGVRMWGGRYIIAVAPTYGTIGTQLDITIGGKKVKAIVGDTKSEGATCQHYDGSFIEFVVETSRVPDQVKLHGSFNQLPQFSGPIEGVTFVGRIPVESSW